MAKTIALNIVFEDPIYGVPMAHHVLEHISTEKNLLSNSGSATAVVGSYVSKSSYELGRGALQTTSLNFADWQGDSEPVAWLYEKLIGQEQDGGGNLNPFYGAKPITEA